jgi:hypothetical protein
VKRADRLAGIVLVQQKLSFRKARGPMQAVEFLMGAAEQVHHCLEIANRLPFDARAG